jgi:hypothetical protein
MAKKGKLILEAAVLSLTPGSRVDVEAGVIHQAKVLGKESRNKRRYPADVVNRRFGLYEGSQVYSDHDHSQLKSGRARPLDHWGGVLRGVVAREGELFGDVHCLKETSAGRVILEAASRFPDKFGLSAMHLLECTKGQDGWETVTDILEVWSVDAVTRPATTRTLFEAEEPMMPEEPPAGPVAMSVEDAFLALQSAVMAAPDYDDTERIAILKDVMKLKSKVLGGGEEEEAPAEEAPAAGESATAPAPQPRTRLAGKVDELGRAIRALTIRQMAGESLPLDDEAMRVLLGLPNDAAVGAYLQQLRTARRPRYSAGPPRAGGRVAAEEQNGRALPAPLPRLTAGADRDAVKRWYRS